MSSAPRRPRRAVRPPGTVGTDEAVMRAAFPAPADAPGDTSATSPGGGATSGQAPAAEAEVAQDAVAGAAPGHVVPAVAATDDLWRRTRSADDSDRGWGREEPSSNDERLRREKPPHW